MRDESAFITACLPIAKAEVGRFIKNGAALEFDDGVQAALMGLLVRCRADEASTGFARNVIRQEIIRELDRIQAVKRGGRAVRASDREALRFSVASHENECIARVDIGRILESHPAPPADTGSSRQAAWQRVDRWRDRVRAALNDNTDQAPIKRSSKEAA